MDLVSRICVLGGGGLVGSAIVRALQSVGYQHVLQPRRPEVDLLSEVSTRAFFEKQRPEYVFFAAAVVGGIHANATRPVSFLFDNMRMQLNVLSVAAETGVMKLLFLGSSCIYPREATQPIREESLLSGYLEKTNEPYAIAKIAGLKMCQALTKEGRLATISLMPTNLFGPFDNFHPQDSHVLPGLLGRFHKAAVEKQPVVTVWGTGTPYREFLYSEDLADAAVYLMNAHNDPDIVNVGTGVDIQIRTLAETIAKVTGYEGAIEFDSSKPDGTPRKRLDVTRLTNLGWTARTPFEEGLRKTYRWYLDNVVTARS